MKFLLILIISIVCLLNKQVNASGSAIGGSVGVSGGTGAGSASFIFKPTPCNQANCFAQPCKVSKCPLYPYAECRDNYCGGCFADYYVDGRKVDCNKEKPCSKALAQCKAAPCDVTSCPAYPYAYCVNNYCGGCYADYYVNGFKVNCNKKVTPCKNIVNCFVAPCQVTKCPAHPNAKCYDNYCGGCNADFYENGFKVDCGSGNGAPVA